MKRLTLVAGILLVGTVLVHAQRKSKQQDTLANFVITPQQTLKKDRVELRKEILEWCEAQAKETDVKKIKAQASAAYYPGAVGEGAAVINKVVHIDHRKIADDLVPIVSRLRYSGPWNDNLYTTGLYAFAGKPISIELPASLVGKEISIQIGSHSDNLGYWVAGKEDWRRMPLIVKKMKVTKRKFQMASPFGGLIYIASNPKEGDWSGGIKIGGATEAAVYVYGKTTAEDWAGQLQRSKAPWVELTTSNIILTVPRGIVENLADPAKVMSIWDLIIKGEMELAQIPLPFYRPQRMVIDEHIGGGFMHSGYPIMIHHSPSRGLLSADIIADPTKLLIPSKGGANWGFFHEIGHNMQNLDWVFGGTTEVSCNFFSLYMFDRLLGGRDGAHSGISNETTQKMMREYFTKGANYDDWKSNPFLGLVMFRQLQEAFGWESFKSFFRKYQALAAADPEGSYVKGDEAKRDLWASTFSEVTGKNIAPFFEAWGIPISLDVKARLSKYPTWMPYNFPSSL